MKNLVALSIAGSLLASIAIAEDSQGDVREGMTLMERGALMFFRGLADEIEPQLEEMIDEIEPAMRGFAESMGPAFDELADMIGQMNQYHPPERLPNGDIILRRKSPLDTVPDGGEIEL
ncbi:MAG: hypothetical protein AAFQ66_08665 [Pseudomonadota bacterium]